jgi:hypothetical protein
MTAAQMLKMGGFSNTKEGIEAFYKEYPTEASFKKKFGIGGSTDGTAFPQQPDENTFFSRGHIPTTQRAYYAEGGIAFPQQPPENMFFSGYPFEPSFAKGGQPCYNCGGMKYDVGGSAFGYGSFPMPQYGGMTMQDPSENLAMYNIGGDLAMSALNDVLLPTKGKAKYNNGGSAPQGYDTSNYISDYKNRFQEFLTNQTQSAIQEEAQNQLIQDVNEAQDYANQVMQSPEMGMPMAAYGGMQNPYGLQMNQMQNQIDEMDQRDMSMMRPVGQELLGKAVNTYKKYFGKKGGSLPKHQIQGVVEANPLNTPMGTVMMPKFSTPTKNANQAPASNPFDQNTFNTMMGEYEKQRNAQRQQMLEQYYGNIAQNYGQNTGYPYGSYPNLNYFVPNNNPFFNPYYVSKFRHTGPGGNDRGKVFSEGVPSGFDPNMFNRELSPEQKAELIKKYRDQGLELKFNQEVKNRWLFPKLGPKRVKTHMELRTLPSGQTVPVEKKDGDKPGFPTTVNTPMGDINIPSTSQLLQAYNQGKPGAGSAGDRSIGSSTSTAGPMLDRNMDQISDFIQPYTPPAAAKQAPSFMSGPMLDANNDGISDFIQTPPAPQNKNIPAMLSTPFGNISTRPFGYTGPAGMFGNTKALGGDTDYSDDVAPMYDDGGEQWDIDTKGKMGIDPYRAMNYMNAATAFGNRFLGSNFSQRAAYEDWMEGKKDPMNWNMASSMSKGYNTFDPYNQVLPGDPTKGLTTTPWGSGPASPRDMNVTTYGAKYGGGMYNLGGVYEMTEDDIDQFMAMGGTIEYID